VGASISDGALSVNRYGLSVNIGLPEILVVLLILLLIFGGRRIPELGRALGTGFRNLREHVGRGASDKEEVESGQGASPPSSSEPVEDEEPAKRP
jgi:sec-independent protein translocase protein TatA